MTRYKKALLAIVAALPLGSALAATATPASAPDADPVIAGALGGFAAGAIIGSTEGGYYPRDEYYARVSAAIRSGAPSMTPGMISSATGGFGSVTEKPFTLKKTGRLVATTYGIATDSWRAG